MTLRVTCWRVGAHAVTMPNPDATPLLVDRDAAASLLSVSRRTLERMIAAGALATIYIGRRRLVPRAELERIAGAGR